MIERHTHSFSFESIVAVVTGKSVNQSLYDEVCVLVHFLAGGDVMTPEDRERALTPIINTEGHQDHIDAMMQYYCEMHAPALIAQFPPLAEIASKNRILRVDPTSANARRFNNVCWHAASMLCQRNDAAADVADGELEIKRPATITNLVAWGADEKLLTSFQAQLDHIFGKSEGKLVGFIFRETIMAQFGTTTNRYITAERVAKSVETLVAPESELQRLLRDNRARQKLKKTNMMSVLKEWLIGARLGASATESGPALELQSIPPPSHL